jgi:hypothetical protein
MPPMRSAWLFKVDGTTCRLDPTQHGWAQAVIVADAYHLLITDMVHVWHRSCAGADLKAEHKVDEDATPARPHDFEHRSDSLSATNRRCARPRPRRCSDCCATAMRTMPTKSICVMCVGATRACRPPAPRRAEPSRAGHVGAALFTDHPLQGAGAVCSAVVLPLRAPRVA